MFDSNVDGWVGYECWERGKWDDIDNLFVVDEFDGYYNGIG